MTVVDEIKDRVDIVDLVSDTVNLRRAGKNYTGFCPFHTNTRTPAFVVFPDSGTWRCFGECNEGGDIFKFVMKKEGWDFRETLQYLAQRAGVELEPMTPEKKERDETLDRLHELLEEAVIFYRHYLLNDPGGKQALDYLTKRGLTQDTITSFGLGYAPNSWDITLNHFLSKGYTPEDLLNAGLVTERREGDGVYDRFRNRVMFAIRNASGRMAGFGARVLDPEDVPKYLNSPQTALFDKSRLLYGLDQARKSIRALDQVVIVEGYMDVIVPHQAGFTNLVSPMGTALTEPQLQMLKRYTRRIVLALDSDAAGEKGTLRGLEIARQAMDHSEEVVFDPRGLIRHEARLQADLRVTTLPEGLDPDEIVLEDPEAWQRIVDSAQPVVIHVMDTLAANQDVDDPKVKSQIAEQVLPLIADVPNRVERESYRQRLARLLHVDERAFLADPSGAKRPARRKRRAETAEQEAPAVVMDGKKQRLFMEERRLLRLLLRNPEELYNLDRFLQQSGLSRFSYEEFEHAEHQLIAKSAQASLEQDVEDPLVYISENIPETLEELMKELQAPPQMGEPTDLQLREDLIRTMLYLRQIRVKEQFDQLFNLQRDLQENEGMQTDSFHKTVLQYAEILRLLNLALGKPVQFN